MFVPPFTRIDLHAVDLHAEVHVHPASEARLAGDPHLLPLFDHIAFLQGYYPGFRTLDQQKFWDAKTREVVLDRVENVPPIRFFTPEERVLMEAICSHILPQDDRDAADRIPILPQIDKRLFDDTHDGYRFEDMPPDREAYRLGLRAIWLPAPG